MACLAGSCLNAHRLVYFCKFLIKLSVWSHLHHHPCTCLKVEVPKGEDDGLLWNCGRNLPEGPSGLPRGWELSKQDGRCALPRDTQCVGDRADMNPLPPDSSTLSESNDHHSREETFFLAFAFMGIGH